MAGPHPAAVDRARTRSARLRARGVRRRRAGARRGADAGGRHRRDAGAAVSRACSAPWAAPRRTCATTTRARSSASSAELDPSDIAQIMREQRAEGESSDPRERSAGRSAERHALRRHGLSRPDPCDARAGRGRLVVRAMTAAFNDAYKAEFGNTLAGIPVMVINVRTTVEGKRQRVRAPRQRRGLRRTRRSRTRGAASISATGWIRRSSAATTSSPA